MTTPTPRRPTPKKKTAAKKTATARPAKKTARKTARQPAKETTTKRASSRRPRVSARDQQVLDLRRAGLPLEAIVEALKFRDLAAANAAYLRALARTPGPTEKATADEVDRLDGVAPALVAAALVLARVVDEHRTDPNATATAARELRMTMTQLRGLAGNVHTPKPSGGDTPPGEGTGKGGTVTWLDELRQRQRDRSTG